MFTLHCFRMTSAGAETSVLLRSPIHLGRITDHRINNFPATVVKTIEKTVLTPGMTGDTALLYHAEQQHIPITVQPDFMDDLFIAGLFSLAPQSVS